MVSKLSIGRPCERRDPYRMISVVGTMGETFRHHDRRWLWVPAFAGTTGERARKMASPSPSLPWGDDFDLVAALERGLGPTALRQHVVIHGDRKMRAFIFEFREQGIDAGRGDLPLL